MAVFIADIRLTYCKRLTTANFHLYLVTVAF